MKDDDDEIIAAPPDIQHVGYRPERTIYDSGDLERAFAYAWLKRQELFEHQPGDHLALMLQTATGEEDEIITQRDARVAATVIQWLGTNCGFAFLSQVLREHGQYKLVDVEAERRIAEIMEKSNQ